MFLSDPAQRTQARRPCPQENIYLRVDIAAKLFDETAPVASAQPIDRDLATSINRALEAIGIRPPQQSRRVGDYQLEQVLAETDFHQDWLARHVSLSNLRRRVRLYTARGSSMPPSAACSPTRPGVNFSCLRAFAIRAFCAHPTSSTAKHGPALLFDYDGGVAAARPLHPCAGQPSRSAGNG
ncbi:MAG: hypothetical protein MZV65_36785 [Chromatiales bacterium]|nr:hypothetical protein [Chromatiales bacterium]